MATKVSAGRFSRGGPAPPAAGRRKGKRQTARWCVSRRAPNGGSGTQARERRPPASPPGGGRHRPPEAGERRSAVVAHGADRAKDQRADSRSTGSRHPGLKESAALTLVWRSVIGAGFALPRSADQRSGGPLTGGAIPIVGAPVGPALAQRLARRPAVLLFRRSGGEETDEDRGERRNRQDEGTPDQADFFLQDRHLGLKGSQLLLNRPEGFLDRRQVRLDGRRVRLDRRQVRRSDLTVVNSDFRFVSTSPILVATA